jgi:hypothetical protein
LGLTRKTKFGFPPSPAAPSTATQRLVPLTQGIRPDLPWTDQPPGSATSAVNFLPTSEGALIPRSRLSSINTIRPPNGAGLSGMAELHSATFVTAPTIWFSTQTGHGIINSNGSLSLASFVSSFGLGIAGLPTQGKYQYAPAFSGGLNDNMLLAVGQSSLNTVLALYRTSVAGPPVFSYLTGAPKCSAIGAFDSYIVAFNTSGGRTRAQWCARGEPLSGWTKEGSGFEDLLAMRGSGTAVKGTADGRMILFSEAETWYAYTVKYPQQFDFQPLEKNVGCPFPNTIAEVDEGLLFLGSDLQLRLLPSGGGVSRIVSTPVQSLLRRQELSATNPQHWGLYDPYTKLYHLFVDRTVVANAPFTGMVLNTQTGAWAFSDYDPFGAGALPINPACGVAIALDRTVFTLNEGLFLGNSSGTIYSTNSLLANDSGVTTTATWRSTPLASELPANYKQVTQVDCDYRATSNATVTLKISQDGGSSYGYTAPPLSLRSAPVTGRATSQPYAGSAYPMLELSSTNTGFELHRLDVSLLLGGQR